MHNMAFSLWPLNRVLIFDLVRETVFPTKLISATHHWFHVVLTRLNPEQEVWAIQHLKNLLGNLKTYPHKFLSCSEMILICFNFVILSVIAEDCRATVLYAKQICPIHDVKMTCQLFLYIRRWNFLFLISRPFGSTTNSVKILNLLQKAKTH